MAERSGAIRRSELHSTEQRRVPEIDLAGRRNRNWARRDLGDAFGSPAVRRKAKKSQFARDED